MDRARKQSPALAEHLRHKLGPELREAFDDAGLIGWLPYAVDVKMAEGVMEKEGPDGLRAFVMGNVEEAQKAPVFRPIIDGSLRLFGASPTTILRIAPKLWGLAYQDVLTLEVRGDATDRDYTFSALGVCDEMLHSRAAQIVLRAQCHLAFQLLGTAGEVSMPKVDARQRAIDVTITWAK